MKDIIGKTIIFTDQHFGIKGNSQLRQAIGINVIDRIIDTVDELGVKNIVFAGDYFHVRSQISVDTINVAYKCMQKLASKCRVVLILGNHDLFMKNSVDINSLNMFQDIENVEIVSQAEEVVLCGKKCLMVPWLADLEQYAENTFDVMIGHFDISSKFLVRSYIEQHSVQEHAHKSDLSEIDETLGICQSQNDETAHESEKHIGHFVDLVKKNGLIFAGHIHQHREFRVHGRKFIFIGSPYQQNLGDIGCQCGYYVFDDGKYQFIETTGIPKHIQLKCGEIIKRGVDEFDYSSVSGNIVQKIYDVDVPVAVDARISQRISDMRPYEELLPDYRVELNLDSVDDSNSSASLIRQSKLEYINKYIENMQDEVFVQNGIEKKKLSALMTAYYRNASGE